MTIDVSLKGQTLIALSPPLAGESLKKLFCKLTMDDEWAGLAVTMIFRLVHATGSVVKSAVVVDPSNVEVPHEVIHTGWLFIGAVGVADNGTIRLTTATCHQGLRINTPEALSADPSGSVTPAFADQLLSLLGAVSNLDTSEKSNLVDAINELVATAGALPALKTADKSCLVAAINEVLDKIPEPYVLPSLLQLFLTALQGITDTDTISIPVLNATDYEVERFDAAILARGATDKPGVWEIPCVGRVTELFHELTPAYLAAFAEELERLAGTDGVSSVAINSADYEAPRMEAVLYERTETEKEKGLILVPSIGVVTQEISTRIGNAIGDVNARIREVETRCGDINARVNEVETRMDDVIGDINAALAAITIGGVL